jgi:hypothetical protein
VVTTTTGAPIRMADQLMDRFAVSVESDLTAQFTRDTPLTRKLRTACQPDETSRR